MNHNRHNNLRLVAKERGKESLWRAFVVFGFMLTFAALLVGFVMSL